MRSVAVTMALSTVAGAAFVGPVLPGRAGAEEAGEAPRVVQIALSGAGLHEVAPFAMLGLTWPAGTTLPPVSVRTRSAGGWGQWTDLSADADGPDPGDREAAGPAGVGPREATVPVWTGPSDAVQLRLGALERPVAMLPTDLRLVLVDPGHSPTDAATAGYAAAANPGGPRIAQRADWGANERLREKRVRYSHSVEAAFLHHAGAGSYGRAEVPRVIRSIYAFHTRGRGWADIGYNFLVDRWGRVWEGRAGGVALPVRGAHTGGFNTNSFGIGALGDFRSRRPSRAMIESIARLIQWKFDSADDALSPHGRTRLTSAGGGTARFKQGREVALRRISGHRDAGHTVCPGERLYATLPRIRERVAAMQRRADLESGRAELGFRQLIGTGEPPAPPEPTEQAVHKQADPSAREEGTAVSPPASDG